MLAAQTQYQPFASSGRTEGSPIPRVRKSAIAETRPIEVASTPWSPAIDRLIPGTAIRLKGPLSEGGSGIVYRAVHDVTRRPLAVKIQRDYGNEHRENLMREIEVLRQIDSPWVVSIDDAGILPDGRPWLSMEYLNGYTLSRRSQIDPVDPIHIVRWLRQICNGLEAIHSQGWAHRDIKLSNIIHLTDGWQERIKIIDLGIAERFGTRPSILSGTPEYMAPEQAESKPVDLRSDVYALGCLAFRLFTAKNLTPQKSALAKINAHIEGIQADWPNPQTVPLILRRLIERCLARAPEARPPNMYVLEREFQRVEYELGQQTSANTGRTSMIAHSRPETSARIQDPITAVNDIPRRLHRRR